MFKIGVISDTHGHLDSAIPGLFAGVSHILHAGDIGSACIIHELEEIAPVTVVLGNNDHDLTYRETEVIELAGLKFLVHHIVDPRLISDPIHARVERDLIDVVVFGHTHKPFDRQVGRARFFNPGYAGRPRFGLGRTAAILHVEETGLRAEMLVL